MLDPWPLLGTKLLGPALNGVELVGPAEDWPGEVAIMSGTDEGALREAMGGAMAGTGASVSTPDGAGPVAVVPAWGTWAKLATGVMAMARAAIRVFKAASCSGCRTRGAGRRSSTRPERDRRGNCATATKP